MNKTNIEGKIFSLNWIILKSIQSAFGFKLLFLVYINKRVSSYFQASFPITIKAQNKNIKQ